MKTDAQVLKKATDNYRVPNLEKGLAILEYLSVNNKGKSLQEIRVDMKISQTTTYRILNTLVRLDYLLYDDETKRYTISKKMLNIGFRSLNEHNLLETVLPHLRELRDEVKETACFGVLGDKKGVFIEQAQGSHAFHFVLSPGKSFDLHCSAPGKAIMAFLPDTVRKRYLSHMTFTKHNERTITTEATYLKELDKVRSLRYALDNEEEMSGVICVGAAIFNYTGFPCGAIWVSGPKDRITTKVFEHTVDSVKKTALKISNDLGYVRL